MPPIAVISALTAHTHANVGSVLWVAHVAVLSGLLMTMALLIAKPCAGDTLPLALITALFEVLSFPALMDDLKINQALEAALLHLKQSHELALTDGGRYQGLYRLMAHPSPQIRAMVSGSY